RLKVYFAQESSSICSFSPDFDEEDNTSSTNDYSEINSESAPADGFATGSDKCSAPPIATIQTRNGPISIALYNHYPTSLCTNEDYNDQQAAAKSVHPNPSSVLLGKSPDSNNENVSSADFTFDEDHNDWSKSKRSSLPKKSVDILRSWLFQNISHPYPTEDEKRQLSTDAGLNLTQVNNWFINARRRILQPLLTDGSYSSMFNSYWKHGETSESASSEELDQNCNDKRNETKEKTLNSNFKRFCSSAKHAAVYSVDNLL
uniref:Homeobox protein unc-62 n=1 Tax=Romanomermis culicivorax TaxID=13658 RepID=A0A915HXK9_ROMCU